MEDADHMEDCLGAATATSWGSIPVGDVIA